MKLLQIGIDCPDRATATQIAERLITARLAASANIGSGIDSIYHWRGTVAHAGAVPMLRSSAGAPTAARR